ncbi:MAG: SRPBCC domain-containing protein [Planctomycetales bacterium]
MVRSSTLLLLALACGLANSHAGDDPPTKSPAAPSLEPLVTEGIVQAPVAELWKVFSTAEGFKRLGVSQCEMDFRVGGLIRTHYDPKGKLGDDGTIENEVLAFEPERMMAFRIHRPPKGLPFAEATWKPTWSVATFSDLGDGRTHLRLVGMGYPATEEGKKMRNFFDQGNSYTLAFLKKQFDAAQPALPAVAHADDPLAPISLSTIVELPRAEVWKRCTTAEGWEKFFGAQATIELIPGGKFEILFNPKAPEGERGSEGCQVQSYLPERMLSFSWNAPPKFPHARSQRTWVVVEFEELAPGRTRVRLEHLGFAERARRQPDERAEWEEVRAYFTTAWPKVLAALSSQAAPRAASQ